MFSSCSDDETLVIGDINAPSSELTKTIAWDETETSIQFTANSDWTATVEDVTSRAANTEISWLKLTVPTGGAGDIKMPLYVQKNDNETYREAQVTIACGEKKVTVTIHQEANPDAVHTMDKSTIANYDKYYTPGTWNEGFEKGPEGMLRSDARWSWWRMKQSEHFFVFWEPGFGDNPNAASVPEALRVDIDDLLEKAEQFYTTNVEKLGMATTGQGQSVLDKYKMQIYLLYQTEWLATGSGYDDMIGALWVNPSTCKPVGSTIGHEIGHSFQYQVAADKLFTGEAEYIENDIVPVGFRYGFGEYGSGGCAYWEQCAQWQSFQDYPQEAFTQDANVQVWLQNHHRHFNHEWMRYASYWFPYWFTQKHGLSTYARIWRESKYPEDPLETYMRLYCNGDLDALYANLYDYAVHCADYDFDAVHQYKTEAALGYSTRMYQNDGWYQVAYSNCPGTTGFNLIALNIPEGGTTVSAQLEGLAPGSALAPSDPGTIQDADGNAVAKTSTYNQQSNTAQDYRYGFVAVTKDGKSHYGEMKSGKNGSISYSVPANTDRLYLCVMAAPGKYNRNAWDDDESNDEQWPYRVKFANTNLLGNITIPSGDPEDVTVELSESLDATSPEYALSTINLLSEGVMNKIAVAFKMQPSDIAGATLDDTTVRGEGFAGPAEGKVAVGLTVPDGSVSYAYSANGIGFWIAADGSASSWGDAPVYFEYAPDAFALSIGHHPGNTTAGDTYTIKPTMVYNKDGKLYKAVIKIKMKF